MFGDALSTPAKTNDAAVTLFIGGVLTLLAVLGPLVAVAGLSVSVLALLVLPLGVLPALVLRGYYVAVIADGANREPGAPSIVQWGKLLSDGVKSVLVSLGYLLPAVLLAVLGVAALVALAPPEVVDPNTSPSAVESSMNDVRAVGALAVLVLGSLLLLGYVLLYAYLRPAALAVFAVSGSLREAFRLGRVRSVAGTGDFAVGWLLAGLVLAIGGLFALPLSALLVGFFLLFYLQVVAHSLYGRGASDVLVPETESAPEEMDQDELEDTVTDADPDADDETGFPSEWAVESAASEATGDDTDTGDTVGDERSVTDPEQTDDTLTDWDDVSDAVESSGSADADDSGLGTSAGGVSPAVQSGRGVPIDETDYADEADSEVSTTTSTDTDSDDRPEVADDTATPGDTAAPDDTDSRTTTDEPTSTGDDTDNTATDDPFDWGPADDR